MALSTEAAHPSDMDHRQVAFSFAIPRGPESFDGRRERSRHSETPVGDGRGKKSMKVTRSLVSVVDDDESVRESLPDLLKEFGFAVRAFSSAEEFLASDCVGQTRCLILDIAMPGIEASSARDSNRLHHRSER
jgi:PleD family two-component response regulator